MDANLNILPATDVKYDAAEDGTIFQNVFAEGKT